MKQSVICRCTDRTSGNAFCGDCGGLIMPNKTPDASSTASGAGKGPTTRPESPSASEATRGAGVDWMTCPHCHVTGHILVRLCKTYCGHCNQLISTCADL